MNENKFYQDITRGVMLRVYICSVSFGWPALGFPRSMKKSCKNNFHNNFRLNSLVFLIWSSESSGLVVYFLGTLLHIIQYFCYLWTNLSQIYWLRIWNFQGYQRNSMWNFQGLIKWNFQGWPRKNNNVEFPGAGVLFLVLEFLIDLTHNFVEFLGGWRFSCLEFPGVR